MKEFQTISDGAEELQDLLRKVHRIKGKTPGDALRRARRVLPRAERKEAAQIAQALEKIGHPSLEPMIDVDRVQTALQRLRTHLKGIDLADRRKSRALSLAGTIAVNLLVVAALFLGWLFWSGQL